MPHSGRFKMDKTERSWVLYDWANSAYVLIIGTIFFSIFFKKQIAPPDIAERATSYIGYANALVAAVLAVLAPVFGTIADYQGRKKVLWVIALGLGSLATLAFMGVQPGQWQLAIAVYAVAGVGYSSANIFYDAFITDITSHERMDRVSAAGYAWGYIGSTIPAVISILLMMNPQWIGLGTDPAGYLQAMRIVFALTALWWVGFSIPMMKNVKQKHYIQASEHPVRDSFVRLFSTFREIKKYRLAFLFLIAYFFYIDGVHTIIYMATAFGMEWGIDTDQLLYMVLAIQAVAFPFAFLYGRLAKQWGARTMLFTGIIVYIVIVFIAFFIPSVPSLSTRNILFWTLGILVGTSQGGVQALSRSIFGKLIPQDRSGEFFGFFNIFGRLSAVMGPLLIGIIATSPERTRWAVLSLLVFFIIGAVFLSRIRVEEEA